MSAADLLSKRSRNAFREELVGWTLAEITTEFDNEGFEPDLTHDPQVGGQRRGLVEQLYHRINFSDPRQVSRVLEIYQTVVARSRGGDPAFAEALLAQLSRDGVDTSGPSFKLPQRGHSPLQPLSVVAAKLTANQLNTQIERIHASIGTDPALAIGTAKELVETTCKTILADLGEPCGTLDLGDLVKAASKALKLIPDGVPNEAKGLTRSRRRSGAWAPQSPGWVR